MKVSHLRNVFSILLILALVSMLTGCGGKSGGSSGPSTYSVGGRITNSSGGTISDVTISFGSAGVATTLQDGSFTKSGLSGSVIVTPAKSGWTFTPENRTVTAANSSVDFVASAPEVLVSGKVVDGVNQRLNGATVRIGNRTATSGFTENGTIADAPYNGTFTIAIQPGNYDLVITKSGFATYTEPIQISTSVNLGDITLSQIVPTYGGVYTDPDVIVPAFNQDGNCYFSVPTPAANSLSFLMLFTQTSIVGEYEWAFGNTASADRLGTGKRQPSLKNMMGTTPLVSVRVDPTNLFDEKMRQKEKAAIRYRDLLLSRHRAMSAKGVAKERVDDHRSFWKLDDVTSAWVNVDATVKAVGGKCVIYVDDASYVPQSVADDFASSFDAMQSTITGAFGTELDEDGNQKLVILMTPLPALAGSTLFGYFDSTNELPTSIEPYSNVTDMIYVNADQVNLNPNALKGTVAHEYQHLLHFSERAKNGGILYNDIWINEGFAMLAADLAGYGYTADVTKDVTRVQDWMNTTYLWSLTDWDQTNSAYGGSYVFARYFYDHYSEAGTLAVNRSAYGGTRAVTDVTGGSFGDVFRSFVGSLAYLSARAGSPDSRLSFPSMINFSPGIIGHEIEVTGSWGAYGTLRPWSFITFYIEKGAANTRTRITYVTQNSGNFGAIAVTGFTANY